MKNKQSEVLVIMMQLQYSICLNGVKRNFWLAKFLTSRYVRMHRVKFYTQNVLRKLI